MNSYLDDAIYEGLILEAAIATPYSVEENIKRGRMAMQHVISSHKIEPRAMYRKDIGWIGFEWGEPGNSPPNFKNDEEALEWWEELKNKYLLFKGGKGISHIIAKREWEGKWIKEFQGQKGVEIAFKLVEVLAKGRKEGNGNRIKILYEKFIAFLSKPEKWEKGLKREEYWLVTGFEEEKYGYQFILESTDEMAVTHPHFKPSGTTPTCPKPYGTRKWTGAANSEAILSNEFYEVNKGWLYDL